MYVIMCKFIMQNYPMKCIECNIYIEFNMAYAMIWEDELEAVYFHLKLTKKKRKKMGKRTLRK